MNQETNIKRFIRLDTYGNIALASFLICVISGVFIAIPYNVSNAYDSISLLIITNPPAVFFRNMHYWSAQSFLIFTLLHTWDYLKNEGILQLNRGVWLRLIVSLLVAFFVMLSGFILKGDADSKQAHRILISLTEAIPLIGDFIASVLFASDENLQLLYVHHIATATIILIFVIYEHARILWCRWPTILIILAVFTLLSFFIHAPLHNNTDTMVKGPWYFIGLQEILHWMSHPGQILIYLGVVLFVVAGFWWLNESLRKVIRNIILILTAMYIMLTIVGFFFRGEQWKWQPVWERENHEQSVFLEVGIKKVNERFRELSAYDIPDVLGKREACMSCHEEMSGFSVSHDPEAIGCTSCHLGNPFSLDKEVAHSRMILVPGNLALASMSCGTVNCHPGIVDRVNHSLMTTNSGIVSVNRFVFDEADHPDVPSDIRQIGHSPADEHLRNLCAKCHLGNEKEATGPVNELSRGGGCTACHLNYSAAAKTQHFAYHDGSKAEDLLAEVHPSLDINISNNHCFGCHSRSGRIATNYEGWHETLLEKEEVSDFKKYRVLQDQRVFEYVSEDVHHTAGMDCIDCHNSFETMGDGNTYAHEEHAVKISCEDCHFSGSPESIVFEDIDTETRKLFDLRQYTHREKEMLLIQQTGIALYNTMIANDSAWLLGKNTGKKHLLSAPAEICQRNHGHSNLTCSSCHTAWAPQCIGCHNEFDYQAEGYDMLRKQLKQGTWVEYVGEFLAEPPTLGVRTGENEKVEPAIPGMILTIDKSGYLEDEPDLIFKRLFAPAAPHTTSKQGRSCKSCHNNPLAIGYGRGELNYVIEGGNGVWKFEPQYAKNKYDNLPEDAWIEFLKEPDWDKDQATRIDFRPFSLDEQKRILRVGACLSCHDEMSEIMINSLTTDFKKYLEKVSENCILPE